MLFPNVPDLPGVPRLPRAPTAQTVARSVFGVIQATGWRLVSNKQEWGIIDQKYNEPLTSPDKFMNLPEGIGALTATLGLQNEVSFNSIEFSKEFRTSNFPTEDGGFAMYNKVELPGFAVVTLCLGGSEGDRKKFLEDINHACGSTNLYTIITPTITYINYNLVRYNYSRRAESGAQILIVTIEITEVRQVTSVRSIAEVRPVDNKEPAGSTPKNSGNNQPRKPGKSLLKTISEGVLKSAADLYKKGDSALSELKSRFK